MKFKTDLEQINERLNEIDKHLKSLMSKKKIVDKLVSKKLFGIGFLILRNTHSLLYEQKELENTIIYLKDYQDMLFKQQVEINNSAVFKNKKL